MTARLLLVRHGESEGNVAATRAERAGDEVVGVTTRDADTPLSATGEEQARALGRHLATLPPDRTPGTLWCSPYLRARRTAELAAGEAGLDLRPVLDERLRDRELGILDGLTSHGVAARFPEEAARRDHVGKLYYRPPGGESWADVALRLRSLLADLTRDTSGTDRTVLVVCHDAVIWLLRYVAEGLTEEELMTEVAEHSVRNASLTELTRTDGGWRVEAFDDVTHLAAQDEPVTEHPGQGDD